MKEPMIEVDENAAETVAREAEAPDRDHEETPTAGSGPELEKEESPPDDESPGAGVAIRILVVDDEPTLRTVISQVLEEDGHMVTAAENAEEALSQFRKEPFPLVITDIIMGKMSGLDLLKEVRIIQPETLVVVMTSHASLETATSALRAGAYDFLIKPFDDLSMISAVTNRAIEKIRLQRQNQTVVERLQRNTEELEVLNQSLQDMVNHDGLTGLFNHRYLVSALETELARSRRHGRTFTLLFIDVDHFKHYNDTHGHLAGDEVLRSLGKILKEANRSTSVCARYGGEEFVVLIPESNRDGGFIVAERPRSRVEKHPFPGREAQPLGQVTVSLGLSCYPDDGTDTRQLVAIADQRLYEAKQAGRNRVVG